MLNQVVFVGRIINEPKIEELNNERCLITVAVPRTFKNENGEYDNDFISFIAYNGTAKSIVDYCAKDDLVGVKGRIQTRKVDDKDIMEVIAEKVTFLSTRRK